MGDRLISLNAAIDAVHKNYDTILDFTSDGKTISYSIEDILSELPYVPDTNVGDMISRQAAVSCISDLLMLELKGGRLPTYNEVYRVIYDLPSAQPEIIHCKDCKYNPNPPECGNAACVLFYGMTDQMGFCHHGERRERE